MEHFTNVFNDSELLRVIKNSLITSLITAITGTLVAYGATLVTARSKMSNKFTKYDSDYCDMQCGTFFLNTIFDDEKFIRKNEFFMGNNSKAYGG